MKALLLFVLVSGSGFSLLPGVGAEHYDIYLDQTLILRQSVAEPIALKKIPLETVRAADNLIIHYRQCHNVIAKGRRISIQDANGTTLKEWVFADGQGKESAMVIPVKSLLDLEKTSATNTFRIFYTSTEFSENRVLASIAKSDKTAMR